MNAFVLETHETTWAEVTFGMGAMIARVNEFQIACDNLPSELRQWDAYAELSAKIKEFVLSMPIVESLAHPSMSAQIARTAISLKRGVTSDVSVAQERATGRN